MSLLRSPERLLEGIIGEVNITPLIGYSITAYDLRLLDTSIGNIKELLPPILLNNNLLGRINIKGRNESNNSGSNQYLNDFINNELMWFWNLPKKVSIKLFEKEIEDVYIIRPRLINEYLVVEEVSLINTNYCQDIYKLGLGESSEIQEIKYWKCNYIDSIKVHNKYEIDNSWIEWISL